MLNFSVLIKIFNDYCSKKKKKIQSRGQLYY